MKAMFADHPLHQAPVPPLNTVTTRVTYKPGEVLLVCRQDDGTTMVLTLGEDESRELGFLLVEATRRARAGQTGAV